MGGLVERTPTVAKYRHFTKTTCRLSIGGGKDARCYSCRCHMLVFDEREGLREGERERGREGGRENAGVRWRDAQVRAAEGRGVQNVPFRQVWAGIQSLGTINCREHSA